MVSRAFIFFLFITFDLNTIFASMGDKYVDDNKSPSTVAVNLSAPQEEKEPTSSKPATELLTGAAGEETFDQVYESANQVSVEEIYENANQVVVEPITASKSSLDMEKMRRFEKMSNPSSYYNSPWSNDDYLPVYKAALKSNLKKLEKLANYNIDFEKFDLKTGETPLHAACRRGNVDVFKFICSRLSNYAPRNRAGITPFSVAVSQGS